MTYEKLTDAEIAALAESKTDKGCFSTFAFARAIESAVLSRLSAAPVGEAARADWTHPIGVHMLATPSTPAEVTDGEMLDAAVTLLAQWVNDIDQNGTGWDDWDENYKEAAYRPGPLRNRIDEKLRAIRATKEQGR